MAIYELGDHVPKIDASAWVAETAQVIGRVALGEGASIWYGAVLRGDNDW
ncbi:MAG TPA: gamma carbonic anhydrase family protein, partial [Rubrivivax sp.]|nr:gamma carbonic anhydrase family protein [Rubrivivax sp.]